MADTYDTYIRLSTHARTDNPAIPNHNVPEYGKGNVLFYDSTLY